MAAALGLFVRTVQVVRAGGARTGDRPLPPTPTSEKKTSHKPKGKKKKLSQPKNLSEWREEREGQMERESPLKRMTATEKEEKIPTAAHNAIAGVKC